MATIFDPFDKLKKTISRGQATSVTDQPVQQTLLQSARGQKRHSLEGRRHSLFFLATAKTDNANKVATFTL